MNSHRFTTADGTSLFVVDEGPADAELTIVMLHGWTLERSSWQPVVDLLRAIDGPRIRFLRYDVRGHGRSWGAPKGTATIAQNADDVAELIRDRVPTGPIVLAAHSMGGMTSMAFAERHPDLFAERVAGVALVATACGGLSKGTLGLPGPIAKVVTAINRFSLKAMLRRKGTVVSRYPAPLRPGMRWLVFGDKPVKRHIAETAAAVAMCHPASMAGFFFSIEAHERRSALAAFRDLPVVIMVGTRDRLTPRHFAKVIAAELPAAELVILPGAGHMLPLERTNAVTDRITAVIRAAIGEIAA